MSGKKKPCNANTCKQQEKSRDSSNNDSTRSNWESISNDSNFMDALLTFMNQSYLTVSEVKEQSGLPAKAPVDMTRAERDAKIKEIVAKLLEKYKELSAIEEELGNFSRTGWPETSAAIRIGTPLGTPPPPSPVPPTPPSTPYRASLSFPGDDAQDAAPFTAPGTPPAQTRQSRRSQQSPDTFNTAFIGSPPMSPNEYRSPQTPDVLNTGFTCDPQCGATEDMSSDFRSPQRPDVLNTAFVGSPPMSPNEYRSPQRPDVLNTAFVGSPPMSPNEYRSPQRPDVLNTAFIGSPPMSPNEYRTPQRPDVLNTAFVGTPPMSPNEYRTPKRPDVLNTAFLGSPPMSPDDDFGSPQTPDVLNTGFTCDPQCGTTENMSSSGRTPRGRRFSGQTPDVSFESPGVLNTAFRESPERSQGGRSTRYREYPPSPQSSRRPSFNPAQGAPEAGPTVRQSLRYHRPFASGVQLLAPQDSGRSDDTAEDAACGQRDIIADVEIYAPPPSPRRPSPSRAPPCGGAGGGAPPRRRLPPQQDFDAIEVMEAEGDRQPQPSRDDLCNPQCPNTAPTRRRMR